MPTYDYVCLDCKADAEKVKGAPLSAEEMWEVTFETWHPFDPKPKELAKATKCPRCGRHEHAERQLACGTATCYVRGNGYMDRAGTNRAMNLHKLETVDPDTGESNDPYHEMREPGEVDDLKVRLKKGGQHKPNTTTLVMGDNKPQKSPPKPSGKGKKK